MAPPHISEEPTSSSSGQAASLATQIPHHDDAPSLGGISEWDEQSQPSHLPSAIKGLGPIERAQYFARQREKEREDGVKLRSERRAALAASQARVKGGVDEHFTGRNEAHMLELDSMAAGGLRTHKEFSGVAAQERSAALLAEKEKEVKRAKKRAKKKQQQDKRSKLSFGDDEEDEDAVIIANDLGAAENGKKEGGVGKIDVSAISTPDAAITKRKRDPRDEDGSGDIGESPKERLWS